MLEIEIAEVELNVLLCCMDNVRHHMTIHRNHQQYITGTGKVPDHFINHRPALVASMAKSRTHTLVDCGNCVLGTSENFSGIWNPYIFIRISRKLSVLLVRKICQVIDPLPRRGHTNGCLLISLRIFQIATFAEFAF